MKKATTLIQLTDIHLDTPSKLLANGKDSDQTLRQVLDALQQDSFDHVICTGDLVDKPMADSYLRLAGYLQEIQRPVHFIAGNHDDRTMISDTLITQSNTFNNHSIVQLSDEWNMYCLNSQVDQTVHGMLDEGDLIALEKTVAASEQFWVVAVHHHPVSINSPWMDAINLHNGQLLVALAEKYSHLKLVIFGHVHQEFSFINKHTTYLGSPSTCVQFASNEDQYRVTDAAPAYRKIELQPSGQWTTDVVYCGSPS